MAVEGVLVGEALQSGVAVDVKLDEVHAVGVVHGHVGDGDAAIDALCADGAFARRGCGSGAVRRSFPRCS